jgi:hypothetical protein
MASYLRGTSVQSIGAPLAREFEKYSIDVSRVRLNLRQRPCFSLYFSRAALLVGQLASANSSVWRGQVFVTRLNSTFSMEESPHARSTSGSARGTSA